VGITAACLGGCRGLRISRTLLTSPQAVGPWGYQGKRVIIPLGWVCSKVVAAGPGSAVIGAVPGHPSHLRGPGRALLGCPSLFCSSPDSTHRSVRGRQRRINARSVPTSTALPLICDNLFGFNRLGRSQGQVANPLARTLYGIVTNNRSARAKKHHPEENGRAHAVASRRTRTSMTFVSVSPVISRSPIL
jgi:hypothetical protein